MLRKIGRNLVAWLVIFMTAVCMLGMTGTTVNAATADEYSVDVHNVHYDKDTKIYTIVDPIVHIPSGKVLTYMTINLRNGCFNSSKDAFQSLGSSHYDSNGSSTYALADLVVFNGTKTEEDIEDALKSLTLQYRTGYDYKSGSTEDELQIEVQLSSNPINLPDETTNTYHYYKNVDTNKSYLAVTSKTAMTWQTAYNTARGLELGGLKGYLAANTDTGLTISDLSYTVPRISTEDIATQAAWTGMTSLYTVADQATGLAAYDSTKWTKISDPLTITNNPSTGSFYAAPETDGGKAAEDDDDRFPTTSLASSTLAKKNAAYYYIACGPDQGNSVTWLNSDNYKNWYSTSTTYRYNYTWYSKTHYQPDGVNATTYTTSLNRADKTYKADTAVYLALGRGTYNELTNASEASTLSTYVVEFYPSDTYTKSFTMTGGYSTWSAGNATQTFYANKDYGTDNQKTTSFKTYLVMNEDATVPDQALTYFVSSASVEEETSGINTYWRRIDGLSSTGRTSNSYVYFSASTSPVYNNQGVSLKSGDSSTLSSAELEEIKNTAGDLTGKKIAVSTGTIDMSGVQFNEPGIYRFKVSQYRDTETPWLVFDPVDKDAALYLDVYVSSDGTADTNKNLTITNYILHTKENDVYWANGSSTASETKRPYFVDQYLTETITIKKYITGNQSRQDDLFDFNLIFNNAAKNAHMTVTTTNSSTKNSDILANGITSSSTGVNWYYNSTYNGYVKSKVWMSAGDTTVIHGVPRGTNYSIGEVSDTLQDMGYKSTILTDQCTGDVWNGLTEGTTPSINIDDDNAFSDTGLTRDTKIVFNNEKNGVIPTGVMIAVAPYVTLAFCGFFGLIVFAKHKKHQDDEEDI